MYPGRMSLRRPPGLRVRTQRPQVMNSMGHSLNSLLGCCLDWSKIRHSLTDGTNKQLNSPTFRADRRKCWFRVHVALGCLPFVVFIVLFETCGNTIQVLLERSPCRAIFYPRTISLEQIILLTRHHL